MFPSLCENPACCDDGLTIPSNSLITIFVYDGRCQGHFCDCPQPPRLPLRVLQKVAETAPPVAFLAHEMKHGKEVLRLQIAGRPGDFARSGSLPPMPSAVAGKN